MSGVSCKQLPSPVEAGEVSDAVAPLCIRDCVIDTGAATAHISAKLSKRSVMVPIQPTIADDPVAVMGWRLGNRDARFGRVPWLPAIPNACTNTRFGIAICSPRCTSAAVGKGFIRNRTWHARRGHSWATLGGDQRPTAVTQVSPTDVCSTAPTGRGTLPSLVMRVRFRHQHHSGNV